jgi:ribosomal protein L11 methyltransferase
MDYYEISISPLDETMREIVMAELSELGAESCVEGDDLLQAFVPENLFDEPRIREYLGRVAAGSPCTFNIARIGAQNWNAIWESQYEPVTIGQCQVRAPFHAPAAGLAYDIIIEPRMSFGTAHHETTSLMISMLMEEVVRGKAVLDMGCGTGVLAILALKMGAEQVCAIDTDEWAFDNAKDNMLKNNAGEVVVLQGDASAIPGPAYDLVIANINRNVLLADIPAYARFMPAGAGLLLSGFYESDLEMIRRSAAGSNLEYRHHETNNNWVGAKFIKSDG